MKHKVRRWAGQVAQEWLEVPPGAINGQSRVVILGMRQTILENFSELISFTSEQVRIRCKDGVVSISGKALSIRSVVPEEMIVEGEILQLEFSAEP